MESAPICLVAAGFWARLSAHGELPLACAECSEARANISAKCSGTPRAGSGLQLLHDLSIPNPLHLREQPVQFCFWGAGQG